MPGWRRHRGPHCEISLIFSAIWQTRRCVAISCLRLHGAAPSYYEQLVADAIGAGELRAETDVRGLARAIEITLEGSFLLWALYQEGSALAWLSEDLNVGLLLRPAYHRRPRIIAWPNAPIGLPSGHRDSCH